jgi:hypothetical protein
MPGRRGGGRLVETVLATCGAWALARGGANKEQTMWTLRSAFASVKAKALMCAGR